MKWESLEALEADPSVWDRALAMTPGVDPFCSGSAWALAAFHGLQPGGVGLHFTGEHGQALLSARWDEEQAAQQLQPCEAMWGFASGLAGEALAPLASELARTLLSAPTRVASRALLRPAAPIGLLLLSGLPVEERVLGPLVEGLSNFGQLMVSAPTERVIASLQGGYETYLGRRGRGFRRGLRREGKHLQGADIRFEDPLDGDPATDAASRWRELYARIQAVEARSWKGQEQVGIGAAPMRAFYDEMGPRLLATGALRLLFARREEEDLAYHFGGVVGRHYRGLQHAYDSACAPLGLGKALHLEMIRRLCEEGIERYDLGQKIDYKLAFADSLWPTLGIFLQS